MKLKLTPGLLCLSLMLLRPDLLPAQTHTLHSQRPAILAQLRPIGKLSSSTNLLLAIGLPLRNLPALTNLLQQIYDPASSSYRHYLTPEQFTAKFGPTKEDYQKIIAFAKAHGLKVTATHPNRLLLDVSGSVPNIEKALHVTMQVYQHPTEKRTFYAPATDPSLDLDVPILEISGLNNYALPHPNLHDTLMTNSQSKVQAAPNSGSGIFGTYLGLDFRSAYLPGVNLDGTGQAVGLLQFDGYTASDIAFYETQAGLPNVPLQNVLLDGFSGHPTGSGGEVEVSLDIEMSVSMAPNLSKVIVYEAGPSGNWHDILNRMANDNLAKQLSCSWFIPGGSADPVADGIFQQMALQGQSFFDASGDDDAYTGLISFAGDSPYVTQVGGTTLTTTGPQGAWVSETVWNAGGGSGSGGGISTQYAIPSWQTNVSMAANQGSTTLRNTPDVALTADNVYVRADGQNHNVGGTSCAAPLWAGFMALVNQQAIAGGHPPVGFINPAVYAIGAGTQYTTTFHDITTGNNKSSSSPNKFSAAAGYDLCTGWGTPNGQNMINALANPEPLIISPVAGFTTGGGVGGPFAVTSGIFSLTNSGTNTLGWTLTSPATWLAVSPQSGILTPGGVAASVTVSLNTAASNLVAGIYTTAILFTNQSDGIGQSRQFALSVIAPPTITQQPTNQAVLDGLPAAFFAQVTGGLPMAFQWQINGTNLTDNGNISGSSTTNLLIGNVSTNNVGTYALMVTNFAGAVISSNASLAIMSSPPVIVSLSANQTVYVGGSAQFSVATVGDKPFAYQWSVNTTNIDGATNATLTLANLQLSQTGNYSVLITNLIGATNSANVLLTVNPIPPCAPVPANVVSWWSGEASAIDNIGANNGSLVNGVTFTNGEVGQAFWFNGSDYVSVPDSPSLDVFTNSITIELWMKSAIIGNNPGWMWLVDKGELSWRLEGTSGADTISFSANGVVAPSELTGTRNMNDGQWHHVAAVYDGTNKFLYVDGTLDASQAATGLIGFDGAPLEIGANAETTSAFQGALDEVTIYHRALSATEIQLIYATGSSGKCPVAGPPVILTQPVGQTNYANQSVSFGVAAIGTQPLSYQWSVNTTNIAGATNASLTLSTLQVSQSGNYSVLITNSFGATNSASVVLVINPVSSCASTPGGLVSWWPGESTANDLFSTNNGSLVNGVTFTNGEVGQAFWFNGSDYVSIPDAPSLRVFTNSLTVELWMKSSITGNNPGWMWLVSKGAASWRVEGTSGTKTISFSANGLTSSPELTGSRNVNDGQWHHVAAVYDGVNKYLYIDGTLDASQPATGNIAVETYPVEIGANAETVSAFQGAIDEVSIYHHALTAAEIQAIYLTGAGGKCPVFPPIILTQPASQATYVGQQAVFSVAVSGGAPLYYQWSFNATNITGATNASLALTNLQATQNGSYSVQITNSYGATNSAAAALTVNPFPSCAPVSSGMVSWWPGEFTANDIAGTNNGSLVGGVTFTNGEVGQAFWFNGGDYVSIPDAPSLRVFTNSLTVELWMKSAITGNNPGWMWLVSKGAASWRVEGTSGTKTISFSANGLTSSPEVTGTRNVNDGQWHHVAAVYDGVNKYLYIDGTLDASQPATGNIAVETYPVEIGANAETVSAFQGAIDEVSIYHRALSASEVQEIYLVGAEGKCPLPAPPIIVTQPVGQTNLLGQTATFQVVATGGLPLSYQWSVNTTNITGATNATLVLFNLQANESGNYSVQITNSFGATNSVNALLQVNPLPSCVSAPTNMVSWWPGESSANDQIGANNGSLVNGVTFTNGEVGQAFWLNGSDYVSIPDSTSLRAFTNSLTVELWMKSAIIGNNPGWMWLVSKGELSWRVEGTSGTKTISFSANGLTSSPEVTGTRNVNDGQWHHVAAVYDGVNKYLYIDGTLDASQPATGNIAVETSPVEIGANAETVSAFQGAIDEVSIYHRALTAAEIESIYNAGAGGKCPIYNPPVITSQPTNETLKAGSTAAFTVGITGTLPIARQWYFNDQNSPLAGATNATFTLPNVQLTNSGVYFVTVTNVAGSAISSNALLTVFLQDHFGWSNLLSPRFVNVPFNAAIQALDVSSALVTNSTGTVILSSTNGVPVNPPVSAAFVQGLWSGKLTIVQPVTNLVLRADDGLGNRGLANPINIVYPPGLGTTVSGSSLLIYWPVGSPAFTLETSSILNSPNWVTVVPGPVTIGGQNFVSLPISTTNNFYRLRYSGP